MTLKSVCPSCGEPSYGVCQRCIARGRAIPPMPSFLSIQVCPMCSDHFFKGKWQKEDTNSAVIKVITEALNVDRKESLSEIVIKEISPTMIHAHVQSTASGAGSPSENFQTRIRVNRVTCDKCSRISGGYYESKVQIRAENRTPERNELETALEIALRNIDLAQQRDRLAFIAKKIWLKEGLDLYVSTVKAAKRIGRALLREMGGTLSDSAKLIGRRDGKDVYRVTFVFRLPEFPLGAIISAHEHVYEICSTTSTINAVDLETGQRAALNVEDLRHAQLIAHRSSAKRTTLVTINDDVVYLLDPETYVTLTIKKSPHISKKDEGKEVMVVKTREGVFIVP